MPKIQPPKIDSTEQQLTIHQQLMDDIDMVLISDKSAKVKVRMISKKVRIAWGSSLIVAHSDALQTKPSK